jgi:hypothetical protein
VSIPSLSHTGARLPVAACHSRSACRALARVERECSTFARPIAQGRHRCSPTARITEPVKQHGRPVWSRFVVHPSSGAKERAPDHRSASRRHVTLLCQCCRRLVRRRRGASALNHRGTSAATGTRAIDAEQVLSYRHLSQPGVASGRLTVLGDASSLHRRSVNPIVIAHRGALARGRVSLAVGMPGPGAS